MRNKCYIWWRGKIVAGSTAQNRKRELSTLSFQTNRELDWQESLQKKKSKKKYKQDHIPSKMILNYDIKSRLRKIIYVVKVDSTWSRAVPFKWNTHVLGITSVHFRHCWTNIKGHKRSQFLFCVCVPQGFLYTFSWKESCYFEHCCETFDLQESSLYMTCHPAHTCIHS